MSDSVCCWAAACCCWGVAGSCCRRRGPRKRSYILARSLGITWAGAAGCVGTIVAAGCVGTIVAAGCVGAIDVETPPPEDACII